MYKKLFLLLSCFFMLQIKCGKINLHDYFPYYSKINTVDLEDALKRHYLNNRSILQSNYIYTIIDRIINSNEDLTSEHDLLLDRKNSIFLSDYIFTIKNNTEKRKDRLEGLHNALNRLFNNSKIKYIKAIEMFSFE